MIIVNFLIFFLENLAKFWLAPQNILHKKALKRMMHNTQANNEQPFIQAHEQNLIDGKLTNSFSKWQFLYQETVALYPSINPISFLKRLAIFIYATPNLSFVVNWLKSTDNPLLKEQLEQIPDLKEFTYLPYVNNRWTCQDRLKAIETHYHLVQHHCPFLNIDNHQYVDLFNIPFESSMIRVTVDKPLWMRKEGEISVSLFLGTDRIYTIMFLLTGEPNNVSAIIGSLQGDGRERLETYKAFTKHFHGWRPRDFLIIMFKLLAGYIGCKAIYAVSDEAHRSNLWYSKSNKGVKYNDIWVEFHGEIQDDGFFKLPVAIKKRDISEISSNKRAMYRRRYELLDALQVELKVTLDQYRPVNLFI